MKAPRCDTVRQGVTERQGLGDGGQDRHWLCLGAAHSIWVHERIVICPSLSKKDPELISMCLYTEEEKKENY